MCITWKHFQVFYLFLQLICFGLTSFNLGLIHHVVCGQEKRKGSERQSAKGPARHSCVVIAPFSLAHAACANTFWKPDAGECVHRDVWGASIPFVPITLINQELQRWDHVTNTSFGFCRLNTASRFKLSMRVGSLVSTPCPANSRSTYTSLS